MEKFAPISVDDVGPLELKRSGVVRCDQILSLNEIIYYCRTVPFLDTDSGHLLYPLVSL